MAADVWGSTWNDSQKDEIIIITERAIETITQLSNVVGRSNPAHVPAPNNSSSSRQKTPSMNFTADFQLHAQFQGRNAPRRILLGVPLDDHASNCVKRCTELVLNMSMIEFLLKQKISNSRNRNE